MTDFTAPTVDWAALSPVVIVLLNSFGKYTRVADARRIRQWMERRPHGPVSPSGTVTLKAAT